MQQNIKKGVTYSEQEKKLSFEKFLQRKPLKSLVSELDNAVSPIKCTPEELVEDSDESDFNNA